MSGTAYDRPLAMPIDAEPEAARSVKPKASSTSRPPSRPAEPSTATVTPAVGRSSQAAPSASPSAGVADQREKSPTAKTSPTKDATGDVKTYPVDGGRVVFDLGEKEAELVSATPEAGWEMQVWKQAGSIRVTFSKDGREVSVFCTWAGTPPTVTFDER